MTERRIGVLIVDDSKVVQMLLSGILEADPEIRVVGRVGDGEAALEFVRNHAPDVILMDLHMPGMDGLEATRRIMETRPVPIIVCTATGEAKEVATTFRVMEVGALDCLEKPVGIGHASFAEIAEHLRQTVKVMSEVKLVRRWSRPPTGTPRSEPGRLPTSVRFVGIGASTGGPTVLQAILAGLPKDFPAPILVVQHIAPGFLPGLVEWLIQTTDFPVRIAGHGETPQPGHAYMAPDDYHMGIGASGSIVLTRDASEIGLRPAVSHLFRSLAHVSGRETVGVLLTGMGKDGARELKSMKDKGAVTIAQDQETSIVYGMPREALEIGGVTHVLGADKIADALVAVVGGGRVRLKTP